MLTINHWRASLVPAAAVIPAPIAYANVVAVKKLVVGFLRVSASSDLLCLLSCRLPLFCLSARLGFTSRSGFRGVFTLRKLECSKQSCDCIS